MFFYVNDKSGLLLIFIDFFKLLECLLVFYLVIFKEIRVSRFYKKVRKWIL